MVIMIARNAMNANGLFVHAAFISKGSRSNHCLCHFFITVSLECMSVRCRNHGAEQASLVAYSFGSRVSKRLDTVVVLNSTTHVCWDGNVNFLRIRKLEIAHNF